MAFGDQQLSVPLPAPEKGPERYFRRKASSKSTEQVFRGFTGDARWDRCGLALGAGPGAGGGPGRFWPLQSFAGADGAGRPGTHGGSCSLLPCRLAVSASVPGSSLFFFFPFFFLGSGSVADQCENLEMRFYRLPRVMVVMLFALSRWASLT